MPSLARAVVAGAGVVLAYVASEALEVAIAQPRPCLDLAPGATVANCPPPTDWSLPSNHATIAVALAVALAFTVAGAARWALPLALAVAASRVAIGVHHPHDVASGTVLAATAVTATTLSLERPVRAVLARLVDRRPRRAPGWPGRATAPPPPPCRPPSPWCSSP